MHKKCLIAHFTTPLPIPNGKTFEALSYVGGSLSQLVETRNHLGEPMTNWKGLGVHCEGLGASCEPREDGERQTKRMDHSWYVLEP